MVAYAPRCGRSARSATADQVLRPGYLARYCSAAEWKALETPRLAAEIGRGGLGFDDSDTARCGGRGGGAGESSSDSRTARVTVSIMSRRPGTGAGRSDAAGTAGDEWITWMVGSSFRRDSSPAAAAAKLCCMILDGCAIDVGWREVSLLDTESPRFRVVVIEGCRGGSAGPGADVPDTARRTLGLRGGRGGPTLVGYVAVAEDDDEEEDGAPGDEMSGTGGADCIRKGLLLPTAADELSVRVLLGDVVGLGVSRKGSRLWPAGNDLRNVVRRAGGDGGPEPGADEVPKSVGGGELERRGGSDGLGARIAGPLIDRELRCTLGARRGGASGRGASGSSGKGSTVQKRTACRKTSNGTKGQKGQNDNKHPESTDQEDLVSTGSLGYQEDVPGTNTISASRARTRGDLPPDVGTMCASRRRTAYTLPAVKRGVAGRRVVRTCASERVRTYPGAILDVGAGVPEQRAAFLSSIVDPSVNRERSMDMRRTVARPIVGGESTIPARTWDGKQRLYQDCDS